MTDLDALDRLRVALPGLVLRPASVAAAAELAERLPGDYELDPSIEGADDPAQRSAVLRRTVERDRAAWRPDDWTLHLIASTDGLDIGMQTLEGRAFGRERTVDSASWLVPEVRGRGLGRAMRSAALALAFEGLEAERAITSAWADNGPSLGVSAALGYRRTSVERLRRGDDEDDLVHLELPRSTWAARRRPAVRLEGVEPALPLFGA